MSRLAFGVYSVTGMYGSVPVIEAHRIIVEAVRLGIDAFDTADFYGRGLGEELLRGVPASFIATKVGYRLDSPRPVQDFRPEYLVRAAEASRRRLGVERIDLLQLHNPPLNVLRDPSVYKALRTIVREGIAEETGVALGPETDVLPHALEALKHEEVSSLQFVYNMLEQEPGATIAEAAREAGVKTLVRVPHAGGVLDETVKPGEEKRLGDHRTLRRKGWYQWAHRVYWERIRPLLQAHPGTPGQKALRYIEDTINPDYIIVIAKTPEKLEEYAGYKQIPPIPKTVLEEIRRIYLEEAPKSPEAPKTLTLKP